MSDVMDYIYTLDGPYDGSTDLPCPNPECSNIVRSDCLKFHQMEGDQHETLMCLNCIAVDISEPMPEGPNGETPHEWALLGSTYNEFPFADLFDFLEDAPEGLEEKAAKDRAEIRDKYGTQNLKDEEVL